MYDVSQRELIDEVANQLKDIIQKPEWADYVKTGAHKERPPVRDDWWFVRVAAILRTVHIKGPIGVSKLRTKYGGRKNRGVKPEKFVKGSGSVIRHALQQLEQAGLVKQAEKGVHKGRITTPKGDSLLFSAAKRVALRSENKVSSAVKHSVSAGKSDNPARNSDDAVVDNN